MSDRRYSTSRWQKTRKYVLERDGRVCRVRGPRCAGIATSVHHIVPSSTNPELFYELDNLVAACTPCNQGGGRRIAVANQHRQTEQLVEWIQQLDQRILVLSEKVANLEQANGHTAPAPNHVTPHIY